jgi:hypothetical protein
VDEERLEPDEERLDPDDRPRELALERLFDEDERLFDFDEEFDLDEERLEPPERLLLPDRELLWGILPWLLLGRSLRVRRLPEYRCSTRKNATVQPRTRTAVQIPSSAGNANEPPARKALLARKAKRGEKQWRRQRDPRAAAHREATRGRRNRRIGAGRREVPGRVPLGRAPGGATRTRAGRRRLGVAARLPQGARGRTARWPRPAAGPSAWRRRRRGRCWPAALPWPGSPAGWL